jgi:hypothetical protein
MMMMMASRWTMAPAVSMMMIMHTIMYTMTTLLQLPL